MKLKPAALPSAKAELAHPLPILGGLDCEPLAKMFVSDAKGALRTLLGAAHKHFIGVLPSLKTGLSNPYEGLGEQALARDSEIDADVVDFQTQAFRLRMMVNGKRAEWICDHLRQLRCGTVQAIEVKLHPSQMDTDYLLKLTEARRLLADIGWQVSIRYEEAIIGSPARQVNRSNLMQDRGVHLYEDASAALEHLCATKPRTSFGELRRVLDHRKVSGECKARAVIATGRGRINLDRLIDDHTPVELLPPPRFISKVRF